MTRPGSATEREPGPTYLADTALVSLALTLAVPMVRLVLRRLVSAASEERAFARVMSGAAGSGATVGASEAEERIHGESSTAPEQAPSDDDVYQSVRATFAIAQDEFFEDGVESRLAADIKALVRTHKKRAVEAVTHLVLYEKANALVANEALATLGAVTEPSSYDYRRWLLERSLQSSSAAIRDGAVVGLAWLDDPHAVPYIRRAVQGEQVAPLRRSMERLLEQLGKEPRWHWS